ncbi:MAG: type III secretion inner membrane ring lipoprotein SctJ [Oligoflexales bacterium]|nr:type III secretion inner membrane ring lipoprotein SctJ [Oligoflexales bacterium]
MTINKIMNKTIFNFAKTLKPALLVLLFGLLASCKADLYSGLTEREANEMLAILLNSGMDAEKEYAARGDTVKLLVDKGQMGKAIQMLKQNGYPRDKFSNMGDIFGKEGLISSPTEEHARFRYALSQEIAETLSNLDGVLAARVHIVLPEEKMKKGEEKPSASVFLKYAPGVAIDTLVPQIKTLVSNGVEGLEYDRVSVALFPATKDIEDAARASGGFLGAKSAKGFFGGWKNFLAALFVIFSAGCCLALFGKETLLRQLKEFSVNLTKMIKNRALKTE